MLHTIAHQVDSNQITLKIFLKIIFSKTYFNSSIFLESLLYSSSSFLLKNINAELIFHKNTEMLASHPVSPKLHGTLILHSEPFEPVVYNINRNETARVGLLYLLLVPARETLTTNVKNVDKIDYRWT